MFITVNCNFFETEYFYTHLSGQGDSNKDNHIEDPLSWISLTSLSKPSNLIAYLTETAVCSSAEQVSDVERPIAEGDTHPAKSPLRLSDVSTHDHISFDIFPTNDVSAEEVLDPADGDLGGTEEVEGIDLDTRKEVEGIDPDTGRYILPPRPNRGVPPKRYTPEKINRKARYSVACLATSHLSEMDQSFEKALYEEEDIPQSWEEAMRHKYWREAMKKEIDALIRNNT